MHYRLWSDTTEEFDPRAPPFLAPYPRYADIPGKEFYRKFSVTDVQADGQCFFRCIALGFHENEKYHRRVKQRMLNWFDNGSGLLYDKIMRTFTVEDGDRQAHRNRLLHSKPTWDPDEWGSTSLLPIAEALYDIRVFVWTAPCHGNGHFRCTRRPYPYLSGNVNHRPVKVLHLLFVRGNHFQLLSPNRDYVEGSERTTRTAHTGLSASSAAAYIDLTETLLATTPSVAGHLQTPSTLMSLPSDICPMEECYDDACSTASSEDYTLTRSSTVASHSSRLSHESYSKKALSCGNIVEQFRSQNFKNNRCCDKKCLQLCTSYLTETHFGSANVTSALLSDVFEKPLDILHSCREEMMRKKHRERSSWLFDKYKAACRVVPSDKETEPANIVFETFIVECNLLTASGVVRIRQEVCEKAFNFVYGVSSSMRTRYKSLIRECGGDNPINPRTMRKIIHDFADQMPETRELSDAEHFAVAFINTYCEMYGEYIPNQALEVLRISFPKKHVYEAYRRLFADDNTSYDKDPASNKRIGKPLCDSKFYRLWKNHAAHIELARWKGDFAICDECQKYARNDSSPHLSNKERKDNRVLFKRHLKTCQLCRKGYYDRQVKAILNPNSYMSIICDGCDSNTTTLPNMKTQSKSEQSLSENMIKCKLMGVRVHAMRDRDYLYLAPPFAAESLAWNFMLECLMRTLKQEEQFRLDNGMSWPRILYIQLDNTSKDNKNVFVKAFFSWLIIIGIFDEIHVNYLPVGHTHEDIDQLFSVLTFALKHNNAYTFPQWADVINSAFNDELRRPHCVQWMSGMHDYRSFIENHCNSEYYQFRSEVYHYKIIRSPDGKQADCFYAKYEYCATPRNGGYFPKDPQPPLRWLESIPKGKPSPDCSTGTWVHKKRSDKDLPTPVDRLERLNGIKELLQCDTNSATENDILWWEAVFESLPQPGTKEAGAYIGWKFRLPDVKKVREQCGAEGIDPDVIDDVEPESPPKHELICSKTWTAGAKKKALQIEKEEKSLEKNILKIDKDEYVFFLIGDDWQSLQDEQEGLPDNALSWGFLLGKVEQGDERKADTLHEADRSDIKVLVHYPANGNPLSGWIPWCRVYKNTKGKTTKTSNWVVSIPRTSVVLVRPEFNSTKGPRKKIAASTYKKLLTIPEIPYCYWDSESPLILKDEATQRLEAEYEEWKASRSESSRTHERRALTALTSHKRTLDLVKSRPTMRDRAALCQLLNDDVPDTIDDLNSGKRNVLSIIYISNRLYLSDSG